jgi:hypothetical protein
MVISIDAVRCSGQLETMSGIRMAVADGVAEGVSRQEMEIMAPGRGILCGLLLSAGLWVGLAAAIRAVMMVVR